MRFEWDIEKAERNFKKHNVEFSEAETVFGYPLARTYYDEAHSVQEKRELIVGLSSQGRLLIVSFTERGPDTIRIISARIVTSKERRSYEHTK